MGNQAALRGETDYDLENDKHVHAIDGLVHELGMPAEVVNHLYREVLDELKRSPETKLFLPPLVSQSVKDRLSDLR
jgi:hypothetical protein